MRSILIVEDDPLVRKTLASSSPGRASTSPSPRPARTGVRAFGEKDAEDPRLARHSACPTSTAWRLLRRIREPQPPGRHPGQTAFDDMKTTVEAIKLGPSKYLVKPLNTAELDLAIEKAFQVRALEEKVSLPLSREEERVHDRQYHRPGRPGCAASSSSSAPWPTPGPTSSSRARGGTGKELVAKAIHYKRVPTGTSPSSSSTARPSRTPWLESELFGHVKGAFTDSRPARLRASSEIAGKGTSSSTRSATSRPTSRASFLASSSRGTS